MGATVDRRLALRFAGLACLCCAACGVDLPQVPAIDPTRDRDGDGLGDAAELVSQITSS